jgi:predicted NodU family carbamoyl transferase
MEVEMIILGINGWMERSHDAAACLIVDGEIIAIAEEERLIRRKHAYDCLPHNAIAFCLNRANLQADDIDVVALGWNMPLLYDLHGRCFNYGQQDLNEIFFPVKFYPDKRKLIPVEFVDHHFAHAASAYCCRASDDPIAIAVLDGGGEEFSVSLFFGTYGRIRKVKSFPMLFSPGFFYEAACQYLGFLRSHAGKLMGLASYGNSLQNMNFFDYGCECPKPVISPLLTKNGILDWEDEMVANWLKVFMARWGSLRSPKYQFFSTKGGLQPSLNPGQKEKNIAVAIQNEFERLYLWYISKAMEITGTKNIAIAGGSTLNCSANGMLADLGIAEKIILQPMANDAGVALGAAVAMMGEIPVSLFRGAYQGPGYSVDQLSSFLRMNRINYVEPADIFSSAANLIAQGKVIAWFDGRMEVGPRALGARSILADARNSGMHKTVNDIKSRELWRPLAPAILEEHTGSYFTKPVSSPYMLVRSHVKSNRSSEIPAVVHIDGSVRPQTVIRQTNANFHSLLENFYQQTGTPLVMSTSFNDEGEPIVCTPYDAVRTFFSTGLDALVLGPFLVRK